MSGDKNKIYNLSIASVASKIGKSERTVYRYVKQGKLPAKNIKHGSRMALMFNQDDIDEFQKKLKSKFRDSKPSELITIDFLWQKYEELLMKTGYLQAKLENYEKDDSSYKQMTFAEYQKKSRVTAHYPDVGKNFIYPALGLAGESGEVIEKIKKIIRDDNFQLTETKKIEIEKELGDVLWYLAQLATEFGLSLEKVALGNIEKLYSRLNRGKIQGSGDNR